MNCISIQLPLTNALSAPVDASEEENRRGRNWFSDTHIQTAGEELVVVAPVKSHFR